MLFDLFLPRSSFRTRWLGPLIAMMLAPACGGADDAAPTGSGGGPGPSSASSGAGGGGGAPAVELSVALPAAGAEVVFSAALRFDASGEVARVTATDPATAATCDALAPHFECLLDLEQAEPGAIELEVVAWSSSDEKLIAITHPLERRAIEVACPAGDFDTCILDRAGAGTAAGFGGVSYLNADDGHATANTSTMTGIDAQILMEVPETLPTGVRMAVVNESRAWVPSGGSCSMPRCYPLSRRSRALALYEDNSYTFWPEHRDHGLRDFYQWQAPFFALSQGSSGSEVDEVKKLLRALAIMSPSARDAAEQAKHLGPVMAFLLLRSRHESDLDYLTTDAFPTALADADNEARLLDMAVALQADELAPIAKLADCTPSFPADWAMGVALDSPYAVGYAPMVDDGPKQGEFQIDVDLSATFDPGDRSVLMFPAVVRGDDSIVVERLDEAGRIWRIRGNYPEDSQLSTNGIERTVARTTVGFFPHNGIWLGPPALVSVGGHPAEEIAPDSNDAD